MAERPVLKRSSSEMSQSSDNCHMPSDHSIYSETLYGSYDYSMPSYHYMQPPIMTPTPPEHLSGNRYLPHSPQGPIASTAPGPSEPSPFQWNHVVLPVTQEHASSRPHPGTVTDATLSERTGRSPVPGPSNDPPEPSARRSVSVRRRVRLPQTIPLAERPSYAVDFKVRGSCGVRMRDVLKDRARLDCSEERVFEATGVRQFRLVIAWPGCSQTGTYIPVQDKDGFITRARLAKLISLHFSRFMEKVAKQRYGSHGNAPWTIGRRGIVFDNLWLLSVSHAQHNIWLADIEVQM